MGRGHELVTSKQLEQFFVGTHRPAQEGLPILMRKLIVSTSLPGSLGKLRISGGDDIRVPGWDGFVSYASRHTYVPEGNSVWEMGISKDCKDKAQRDFNKRTADTTIIDKSITTYVAVTPHVWTEKDEWAEECKSQGVWKDVVVIDGSLLSAWLDASPAVAAWFHTVRGVPNNDVDDIEYAWRRLVDVPVKKTVPASLIIAGRNEAVTKFQQWMQKPEGDFKIGADSSEEVELFVLAAARQLLVDQSKNASSILIARSREALAWLSELLAPTIVLTRDLQIRDEIIARGYRHVHCVYCVETFDKEAVDIRQIDREVTEKELQAIGYSERESQRIVSESKGSVVALLWGMGSQSLSHAGWLREPVASELAALVLVSAWNDQSSADRALLEKLAERPYKQILGLIRNWQRPEDPLARLDANWSWRAWRVVWERLAVKFTSGLVNRFAHVAIEVLGDLSDRGNMSYVHRFGGRFPAGSQQASEQLRESLVRTIAMCGTTDVPMTGVDGRQVARYAVEMLLNVEEGGVRWLALAHYLPDLAEAAPDAFMNRLSDVLEKPDLIAALFAEHNAYGHNAYCNVLWALERIAWNPEYLSMVLVLLGRLAQVDPGGTFSNRPSASLRAILLAWYPGTSATIQQRLAAFDVLSERLPEVAWKCGLDLLPRASDTISPTDKPRYRQWRVPDTPTVLVREHTEYVRALFERLAKVLGDRHERWLKFIEHIPSLVAFDQALAENTIAAMPSADSCSWTQQQRTEFRESVQNLVHRYENSSGEASVSPVALDLLRVAANKFPPLRPQDEYRWVFGNSYRTFFKKGKTSEERNAELKSVRKQAVTSVMEREGVAGVLEWAKQVDVPSWLGDEFAKTVLHDREIEHVLEACFAGRTSVPSSLPVHHFGDSCAFEWSRKFGIDWVNRVLANLFLSGGVIAGTAFAMAVRPTKELWNGLQEVSGELASSYWKNVRLWHFENIADAGVAISHLLKNQRNYTALTVASTQIPKARSCGGDKMEVLALCRQVLSVIPDHAAEVEPGLPDHQLIRYSIGEVLEFVETEDVSNAETRENAMLWEWVHFDVYRFGPQRGLKLLFEELSRSPEFFTDVLTLSRQTSSKLNTSLAEKLQRLGTAQRNGAWNQLLIEWDVLPGMVLSDELTSATSNSLRREYPMTLAANGKVDRERLSEWITRSRHLAAEAELQLDWSVAVGHLFSFAPADSDGTWPCKEVRDQIESLADEVVVRNFISKIFMRRGTHFVGKTGSNERNIAAIFGKWASAVATTHPRTASALRQLSEFYLSEGKSRDDHGQIEEFID
ncbi:MAG: hypothetical protein U0640_13055 [Phycisphaerales bacterium]